MTKSKNRILNFITLLVLVPMFILSLFVAFPKQEIESVSADYVDTNYYFHSSDTYYITSFIPNNKTVPVLFSADTFFNNGSLYTNFDMFLSYVSGTRIDYYPCNFVQQYAGSEWIATGSIDDSFLINYDTIYTFYTRHDSFDENSVYFRVRAQSGFNANVVKVHLGCYDSTDMYTDMSGYKYFEIVYYSDNGYCMNFSFLVPSNYKYSERTYYLYDSSDLSDNFLYSSGYSDGYSAGNSAGNNQGYKDGYSAGESIGYGNGYNAGLEHGGNYSFNSLIGAVIDAPVSAFTSLLNFELLGVNILGFITGLLTLALIIFIIKLCMGGK